MKAFAAEGVQRGGHRGNVRRLPLRSNDHGARLWIGLLDFRV